MTKLTLNKAVLNTPRTGECVIDLQKVYEAFDQSCSISQWHNEYTLVRATHKGKRYALKARISEADAKAIIQKLRLAGTPSAWFISAATYRLPKLTKARVKQLYRDLHFPAHLATLGNLRNFLLCETEKGTLVWYFQTEVKDYMEFHNLHLPKKEKE